LPGVWLMWRSSGNRRASGLGVPRPIKWPGVGRGRSLLNCMKQILQDEVVHGQWEQLFITSTLYPRYVCCKNKLDSFWGLGYEGVQKGY
jgi:hypothetical protein